MKIYDELTGLELTDPDTDAGYLYTSRRLAGYEPTSYEVDSPDGPRKVTTAYSVYENCQMYHKYTEAEIEARNTEQTESSKPTTEQRLDTVEQRTDALESANDDIILMMADLIGGEE